MWDIRDVGYSGCGVLEMWDVRDLGYSGCRMLTHKMSVSYSNKSFIS